MAEAGKLQVDHGRHGSTTAVELTDAHGRRRTVDVGQLNEADLALAEQFGYQPVFQRKFGFFASLSFAVSISGLFATITTTFYYPALAGGAASIVWSWVIGGIGCMCIALSVSELMSAMPTCGGTYFTISKLAPTKYVAVLSYYTAWLNLLGQIAGVASSQYGGAQILLAAVSIGSDYNYLPTAAHTIAVMVGLSFVAGLVNSLGTDSFEKLTRSFLVFHGAVLISCCIALLVLTPEKNSASYVFTHIDNPDLSGWQSINPGLSFLFGFLSVAWTMTDYDALGKVSEEVIEPEVTVPRAISAAMALTWIVGILFNIILVLCMGQDTSALVNSPLVQPVLQLFYNSGGKAFAIVYAVGAFLVIQFVVWSALSALSRTVFSFSRDKLLPLSNVWTKINAMTGTPLYAVWISTFLCCIINFIALGNYIAIAGVFNLTSIALDFSYTIPIIVKMFSNKWVPGPWHLGVFSFWINAYAVAWTFFVSVIFIFPVTLPVTADNFNYVSVFLVFILLVATIWWFVRARKVFTGPISEVDSEAIAVHRSASVQVNEKDRGSESNESQERETRKMM